ncbi:translation initiation factor IF-2-like [Amphibalanus amphitrite]|uniref:translation initiation factor IF-2-like n=1 Tax=Amphibalanus amphitrite TaxID=1232801 RepID=UPI001C928347|nr:translation initiation factor IF-2-like [Amphibalanus amphitrite]
MPLCELYRLWRGETACPAATAAPPADPAAEVPPPADPAAEVPPAFPDPAAEVPPAFPDPAAEVPPAPVPAAEVPLASPVPPTAAPASTETASYAQDGCDAGQPAGPGEPPADDRFSTAPQSPAGPPPAVPLEAAAAQPAGRPFRTRCAVRWAAPSYHGPRSVWSLLRAACLRPGCRVLYRGSALPRPSLGADLGLVLVCARCGGQLAVSAELPLTLHPLEGGGAPLEALASSERLLGVPVDLSALLAVHRSVEDLIERAGRGLVGDLVLLPLPEAPRRYMVVEATLTDLAADTDCYTDGMAD